jgi:hypothetical protein
VPKVHQFQARISHSGNKAGSSILPFLDTLQILDHLTCIFWAILTGAEVTDMNASGCSRLKKFV